MVPRAAGSWYAVCGVYIYLKLVHIAAVIAFLGNISTGLFWKSIADRSGSAQLIEHTVKGIMRSDRLITIPSIIVLLLAGIATALIGRLPLLHTGWILWSLILFTISGLAFAPLSRVQAQLADAAATGLASEADKARYDSLSGKWNLWGAIALGAPVIVLVLMVVKPVLPSLP